MGSQYAFVARGNPSFVLSIHTRWFFCSLARSIASWLVLIPLYFAPELYLVLISSLPAYFHSPSIHHAHSPDRPCESVLFDFSFFLVLAHHVHSPRSPHISDRRGLLIHVEPDGVVFRFATTVRIQIDRFP